MGVDIEVMTPGNGSTFPKAGTKVTCHYVLTLTNGKKNWFFKRPRQAIWVQCWSRRGYCRMGWGTHQDVHWRASKIDHFSWYGLRCQRSARLYSPQLNTGIWCWAVESIVNTRKKKKASQEINAFFCEDVAWFWIRLKPIFETESVIMSIPKFLSISELSFTLFDWSFVYKFVVDESLVDVGISSLQMNLKVGENSSVGENYLFPFHFWTKIFPPIKILYHNSYSFFPNKIEIKELKT